MKHLKLFFALFAMLALGVGNAWAETVTYQHVFDKKPSTGNSIALSGVNWKVEATNLGNYNSGNYAGVQIGTSSKNGSITLTSVESWGTSGTYKDKTKITEVRLWLNLGGTSVTPTVTIGGKSATSDGTKVVKNSKAGTDWTKATKVTFTPVADGNTGVVVINVSTVKAGYICAMEIDCEPASSGSGNEEPVVSLLPKNTIFGVLSSAYLLGIFWVSSAHFLLRKLPCQTFAYHSITISHIKPFPKHLPHPTQVPPPTGWYRGGNDGSKAPLILH